MSKNATSKKLAVGIIVLFIILITLCFTTFTLVWAVVTVDNNLFHTGNVKINLNDGKPVIEEYEFCFEPGMTVKKDFFIENQSTVDVYYKLYFYDIDGGLADVLQVTITDNEKILCSGKMSELTKANTNAVDDILKINERRELSIYFNFPAEVGNEAQNMFLAFSLNADAVQTKNNPNKLFN